MSSSMVVAEGSESEDPFRYALSNEPAKFSEDEFHRLLLYVSSIKASDLKIQSGNHIFAKINGQVIRLTRRPIPAPEVENMLVTLYGANGPARIKSGKPIDRAYELHPTRTDRYRFRVNAVGGMLNGNKAIEITIRVIVIEPPTMDQVRLEDYVQKAAFPKDGIFIMAGATGSGKSTTLAAIIRSMLEQPNGNRFICTFEAPIEYVYDTVLKPSSIIFQTEIGADADLVDFPEGIRSAMRRAPDVIVNGEVRDIETVESTLAASNSGHAVYTTVHANSVADTFTRIVGFFPQPARQSVMNSMLSSVRCICWQTLLRTKDGKGRVAIREYLNFTREVRVELLSIGADNMDRMLMHLRKLVEQQGCSASQSAQKLYDQGLITEDDLITVSSFG